ncbi:hypothetical protein ACH9EU_06690 [Kocuria sp. M1R5S2]|uniref:hypothetical protein n=1 Tax=Kocuria rhizosphaerae TaxID=3376285 RepID=UPI003791E359
MSATHAANGTTHHGRTATTVKRRITAGVIGGLAGGLVFGVLMAMTGMLPMVAALVGGESAVLGFGVHLVYGLVLGLVAVPVLRGRG